MNGHLYIYICICIPVEGLGSRARVHMPNNWIRGILLRVIVGKVFG